MTPADLPTYMREILVVEFKAFKYADAWSSEIESLEDGRTEHAIPANVALSAMHRVYLDRDEGRSLREAKIEASDEMVERALKAFFLSKYDPNSIYAKRLKNDMRAAITAALSPAQRSSLPLPDRERTAGRDSSMISCDPAPDASRPHAPNGTCKSFTVPAPDIVDKREDRSAREEDSGFSWNGFNVRGDRKSIQAVAEATHSHAIVPELRAMICKLRDELKPRAADVTSPTPPDSSLVTDALTVVNEQADDEGLWFIPKYISEDYLQRALRRLHSVVEKSKP